MTTFQLKDNLWWFEPIQVFAVLGAAVNFGMCRSPTDCVALF